MKQQNQSTPLSKALRINSDDEQYGTFAEIGAGQEVARHFFLAGRASHTIAKTMSAYDMTFSDEIYGREDSGRYVVESRLLKMLDKEYNLLDERLSPARGDSTCFFAFANTVSTSSVSHGGRCHGWMGIRFQSHPKEPPNDIILHVNLLDHFRLQQQEALGILGVNLVHASLYNNKSPEAFVSELIDSLALERIDVDLIRFNGPALKDVDNRILNLELLKQKLTSAIMFDSKGEIIQPGEHLYGSPVLIQRGTFRPLTKTNLSLTKHALKQMNAEEQLPCKPLVLMEMSMDSLKKGAEVDSQDFINRVDTITAVGHNVLISNLYLFYELKSYIRQSTTEPIHMVMGAGHLSKLFDEEYYKNLNGGTLEAFAKLFDSKTKLYIYPFKTEDICLNTKSFFPDPSLTHLYQHLTANKSIVDILNCDDIDTSLSSSDIRPLLEKGDPQWESLVPEEVKNIIKKKQIFGYKK